ncbi:MAG: hypothetical protein ACE37H_17970 [Phycisphaeraceae bacterium]
MIHVAILKPGYIDAILAGHKTVESRLTKTAQPPFGRVSAGERLFLKASGGPFMATAIAGEVSSFGDMLPRDVAALRKRYNKQIAGDKDYWHAKRDSRFATLIELADVEPIAVGPQYKVAYMKAWYVLDERSSPVRDWAITAGALRNRYACLPSPEGSKAKPGARVLLELPDGAVIETELVRGRMLRWRGWAGLYDSAGARPGDTLRFIATGPGRYRVRVVKR